MLIFDEVQCGNGRTGQLYCYQWSNTVPDILATAKGLGAGFPVAACLASEEVARGFSVGSHGTTFGGNPLAMAIGNAVLDQLEQPFFLSHVQEISTYLRAGLVEIAHRHPEILSASLRGRGMMIGVPACVSNTEVVAALRDEGLLAVTARDNIVRLLPPLILTKDQANEALAAIEAACKRLQENLLAACSETES